MVQWGNQPAYNLEAFIKSLVGEIFIYIFLLM